MKNIEILKSVINAPKKKWITPELTLLSSNDIEAKGRANPKEGTGRHFPSFTPISAYVS